MSTKDDLVDSESLIAFEDQYISVLLEWCLVRHETQDIGPMARSRVRQWDHFVNLFERAFPAQAARKARYRCEKAEAVGCAPVEIAMVRYAWTMYLSGFAGEREVLDRWAAYLCGEPVHQSARIVDFGVFRARRQVQDHCARIKTMTLWPWGMSSRGGERRRGPLQPPLYRP